MKLKSYLKPAALLLCLALTITPAMAAEDNACLKELKATMQKFDDQIPYSRVYTRMERDGQVMQEQRGAYVDETHFVNESLRHNYWTMVRGNDEYRSRDGKTWEKFKVRAEGWAERARAYGKKIIEEVSDASCGETEKLDGKTYKIYTYTHTAMAPAPIRTNNKIYVEPDTGWRYRWISKLTATKPETVLTNTFTRDKSITLPDPEQSK